MKYPSHLLKLIDLLRKLPGVGLRSAERFAFEMIEWKEQELIDVADAIRLLKDKITLCEECGALAESSQCAVCASPTHRQNALCIVASPRDLFAIAATQEYQGLYHVLGALLSPLHRIGPDQLNLGKLKRRIEERRIDEIIIALDSTLEGDATALYLKEELGKLGLPISRLAFGLPLGSSLDYVDGGTLARSLLARARF